MLKIGYLVNELNILDDNKKELIINPDYSEAWYNKGVIFSDIGEISQALECYDITLKINPNCYEALFNKGLLLLEAGQYKDSLKSVNECLLLRPHEAKTLLNKGYVLAELYKYSESLHYFDYSLEFDSNISEAWLNKGFIFAELNQYNKAIEAFEKAIDINPDFAEAFYNKGVLYAFLKKSGSLKLLNKATEINKNFEKAWYIKGKIFLKYDRFSEALMAFNKAIEIEPKCAETWYNKGVTLLCLNRHEEALKTFSKALNINPYVYINFNQNAPFFKIAEKEKKLVTDIKDKSKLRKELDKFLNFLSFSTSECIKVKAPKYNILNQVNRHKEELATYNRSVNFDDPDLPVSWYKKGNCLALLGRKEEALKAYDKALELDSENFYSLYQKGKMLSDLDIKNIACDTFNKVLSMSSDSTELWIIKGNIFYHLQRYEEAIEAFDHALNKDPSMVEAYHNKGASFYHLKCYEEAINCFDEAISRDCYIAQAYQNKGSALYRLGKYEDCIKAFDEALARDPNMAKAYHNKGIVLCHLGKYLESIESLDNALKSNPLMAEPYHNKGIVYSLLRCHEKSIESFNVALELNLNTPELWSDIGIANLLSGFQNHLQGKFKECVNSFNQAVDSLTKATEIKPDFLEAWSNLAIAYDNIYDDFESLQAFDKAIEINSNSKTILYNLGIYHYDKASKAFDDELTSELEFNNAIWAFDKAISINPHFLEALYKKGRLLYEFKQVSEALEIFEKILEINPEFAKAWYGKATIYLDCFLEIGEVLNKEEKHIQIFNELVKIIPCDYVPWKENILLQYGYYIRSKYENALKKANEIDPHVETEWIIDWTLNTSNYCILNTFDKSMDIDDNSVSILAQTYNSCHTENLFSCSFEQREGDLNDCDEKLNGDPDDVHSWCNKGLILLELGRLDEALKSFETALILNSKSIEGLYGQASVFFKLRKYEKALKSLDKILETHSEVHLIWYKKGCILYHISKYENALEAFDFCLDNCKYKLNKKQSLGHSINIPEIESQTNIPTPCRNYDILNEEKPKPHLNIKKLGMQTVKGSGISFEEFVNVKVGNIPTVMQLSMVDDELMLYEYYKKDHLFVPNLKYDGIGYKSEYSKLEKWFSKHFFELLRERVSINNINSVNNDYFSNIEVNFVEFIYSFNEISRYLNHERQNKIYFGSSNVSPILLFLKKIIRTQGLNYEIIDVAGSIFVPGSAMFFLELYVSLKNNHLIENFQTSTLRAGYSKKLELTKRPLVLLIPWEHQQKAFEEWSNSNYNGIVQMATGTGKTLVGFLAIEALYNHKKNGKVLVIAHSKAILNQWRREAVDKLGLIADSNNSYTVPLVCNNFVIEFNTYQSVSKDPGNFYADLLIADEVHHSAAPVFSKALSVNCNWKMGLSAAIEDERSNILEEKLGPIVYNFSLKEAIAEGILPRFEWKLHTTYLSIEEKTDFQKLSKKIVELFNYIKCDTYTIKKITDNKKVLLEDLYDLIKLIEKARYKSIDLPDNWKKLQTYIIQRRWILHKSRPKMDHAISLVRKYLSMNYKIVVFAKDIKSCDFIFQELKKEYENVFLIHSDIKGDVSKIINEFRNVEYGVLIGADMLNEGIDIPDAEIGINISSSKTRLELIQRIGRILRMKKDKKPVFHHYIALPEPASYLNEDDNIPILDELSWVKDTALKMGIDANLEEESNPVKKLRQNAERIARERYTRTRETALPSYGTLRLESILNQFSDSAINKIIFELENLDQVNSNYKISDAQWTAIIRKAHLIASESLEKDEALDIQGYWWILVLGDRNPIQIKEILLLHLDNNKNII